jgi:phosphatidylglycerophosphatase A
LFFALIAGGPWVLIGGILLTIPLSAYVCGSAEKSLGQTDPGSVVFDEIIAIPISFLGWVILYYYSHANWPTLAYFMNSNRWWGWLAIFGLFRLFDIWKPWPVRQSQSLPGGWGVTVDDVLAGVYVSLVTITFGLIARPAI